MARRGRNYEPIGVAHIGTLLAEAIGDADRVKQALGVWPAWEEAVGPQIAASARPASLRDGVLLVHVKNNVWLQELVAMRETLLRRVRKVASARVVQDLRFRVAPLPEKTEIAPAQKHVVAPRAPIPYDIAQTIRRIESPRLRAVMLRVASRWAAIAR
jgi:hypothetical protein